MSAATSPMNIPRWDCSHAYRQIEEPWNTWTSVSAFSKPPSDAVCYAQFECRWCGGREVFAVGSRP
jgi:hypothetical protein